ncbi:hypothetical protein N0B44_17635 [Roseibacterium beibuensis]|uniref:hypothetical protein n=1 Tax=[Roseibacterium] beibuensis TaxID=1193142 RepID=UPI00217D31AF|nr:hypothetical protein [Roseibacterium beibuensis]MCS6624741.1 hypothetical protein [Roseibacterium beibuensis]
MADWLSRLVAWGQGYERVLSSRGENLIWLITLAEELSAKVERGEKRDLRSLTASRAAEARARLQADITAYQALSTTMPEVDPSLPMTAAHREQIRKMALTPDLIGTMLISTGQSSDSYLALYEAAGSGRPEDMARLGAGLLDMNAAQLEAEITMLSGALGNPEAPNHYFTLASIETNKAIIVWLKHRRALLFGEPVDGSRGAAGIRRHAGLVTDAAGRMDAATERLAQLLRSDPEVAASGFGEMMGRLFVGFHEAAEIERDIAVELEAIAAGVEKGDLDAEDAASLRLDALVVRRIEADSAQREMMAQMGA